MSRPRAAVHCPKGALFLETESTSARGRGRWYARVPAEHSIEDVLHPGYFGLQIGDKGFRAGDLVDIEPEGAAWAICARVMAVLPNIQEVRLREFTKLREVYEVKPPAGYAFQWDGTIAKWAIFKGDVRVDAGFDTQDECLARTQELMRQKAA